jgi:type II secretion system protein N
MAEASTRANVRETLVLGALYTGFFVVVFVISAYLTFPYERVRDLIMSRASTTATIGPSRSVQIGELVPFGLGGVRLKDVEIVQTSTPAEPPSVLRVAELSVHLSPWALLFGERKLELHAAVGGGHVDAKYLESSTSRHIQAELDKVDVAQLGLGSYVGLPVRGKASGNIDLTVPAEAQKSTGTVKLEIKGVHIGDGKAKIKIPALGGSGLTLDEINAGKLELGVQVQDELATLTRFATDGSDLKLSGKGSLRLTDILRRSRPDLTIELTFSDAFKAKSDRAKAMFEIIGMRPEWQHATTPDGTIRVHVGGTLQALRAGPAVVH